MRSLVPTFMLPFAHNAASVVPALLAGINIDWTVRIDTLALAIALLIAGLKFHRDWLQITYAVNLMWMDYCDRKGIPWTPIAGLDVRQAQSRNTSNAAPMHFSKPRQG